MTPWELPQALTVNGVDYDIRTDFRAVLDVLIAFGDPELDDHARIEVMLKILYLHYELLPDDDLKEAVTQAIDFIDCGLKEGDHRAPRTMDWEQDAGIILPAVNKVAGKEIRAERYMHWWTFMGYFMEIGESVFSNVQGLRYKKAKGQKLEKWEQEYWRENRALVELKEKYTQEELEEQDHLMRLLD